jgi:alkanesulfonate monooxygenase SsuD/methylene tetrahydromethanopterin reductase-like flavin-dependent oxidoreductase (luciferase family)
VRVKIKLRKIKFAIRPFNFVPNNSSPKTIRGSHEVFRDIALSAERLGYHAVTMFDHLMTTGDKGLVMSLGMYDHLLLANDNVLEHWAMLGYLASITRRIRIASNMACINFRPPSVTAKAVSTVDILSNGRFELGLGTGGDPKKEVRAYGLPDAGPPSVRSEKLAEYLEVMKKMWTEEVSSFKGKYYSIDEATCIPKPVQRPHPPINIPGRYPNTLRVAARHADIFTPLDMAGPIANLKPIIERNELLKRECEQIGRNYDEIEKAVVFRLLLAENDSSLEREMAKWLPPTIPRAQYEKTILCCTPTKCISTMGDYVDAGITYFFLDFMDVSALNGMELFAEEVMERI